MILGTVQQLAIWSTYKLAGCIQYSGRQTLAFVFPFSWTMLLEIGIKLGHKEMDDLNSASFSQI